MLHSTAGRLLVATPLLTDPNFERTVVLVCMHDAAGAFGIVLNRPVEAMAEQLLPEWGDLLSPPGALYSGGPVERSLFIGLGRMDADLDQAPDWFTPIRHGLGLVNLAADVEAASALLGLRVYHGYTGWGANQLDAEIGEDAWFVVNARPEDPFAERPERLWSEVLHRQRGPLSIYATYPEDPKAN